LLQESQWLRRDELEEYQMQQLSKLLNHAYENVPYYQKVFDQRGLKPEDIQDFDELEKLPLLTIRPYQKEFI
jgi:phenylacetate-CoA ligase